MLRTIVTLTVKNRTKCIDNVIVKRTLSFGSVIKSVQNYFQPQASLPYFHVCQIGDPVLRTPTQYVEPDVITSQKFQREIKQMIFVMRSYGALALSANQLGLSHQIFVAEITRKRLLDFPKEFRDGQNMVELPLIVCINPKMKILDYKKTLDTEECLSLAGYQATIPRALAVEVTALDPKGESFTWRAEGFTARLIQHEMDHLKGMLYVDRMDPKTFKCIHWSQINEKKGKVGIKFYSKSWLHRIVNF